MEIFLKVLRDVFKQRFYQLLVILVVISSVYLLYNRSDVSDWLAVLSVLLLFIQACSECYSFRKSFARLEGEYKCGSYKFDQICAKDLIETEKKKQIESLQNEDECELNGSVAKITYIDKNIIRIKITEKNGNTWNGDAIMESKHVGIMSFYYSNLGNNLTPQYRNGVRRVAVLEEVNLNYPMICLFSELNAPHGRQRFGREILIRKESSNPPNPLYGKGEKTEMVSPLLVKRG